MAIKIFYFYEKSLPKQIAHKNTTAETTMHIQLIQVTSWSQSDWAMYIKASSMSGIVIAPSECPGFSK